MQGPEHRVKEDRNERDIHRGENESRDIEQGAQGADVEWGGHLLIFLYFPFFAEDRESGRRTRLSALHALYVRRGKDDKGRRMKERGEALYVHLEAAR